MTNSEQEKIKELLRGIVGDIFDCLPANPYTDSEKKSALERIDKSDLLTAVLVTDIVGEYKQLYDTDLGYQ